MKKSVTKATRNSSEPATHARQPAAGKPKETKKEKMLALLRRDGGATLDEVGKLTGWQSHTTRAVFTGLRKKGFALDRTRAESVTRYTITAEPSA